MHEGVSQYDLLNDKEVQFYEFAIPDWLTMNEQQGTDIQITAESHSGSVKMFLNLNSFPKTGQKWYYESSASAYDYPITEIIKVTEIKNKNINRLYIAIQCQSDTGSLYAITISFAKTIVQLSMGQMQQDTVFIDKINFYSIDVLDARSDLTITLQALTDSVAAPFIYVSTLIERPGPNQNYTECQSEMELLQGIVFCVVLCIVLSNKNKNKNKAINVLDYTCFGWVLCIVFKAEHSVQGSVKKLETNPKKAKKKSKNKINIQVVLSVVFKA